MAEDLKILIGAEIDPASLANIQSQIQSLVGNKDNKITLTIDVKDIAGQVQNAIGNISNKAPKLKLDIDTKSFEQLGKFDRYIDADGKTFKTVSKINKGLGETETRIRNIDKSGQTIGFTKQLSKNYDAIRKEQEKQYKEEQKRQQDYEKLFTQASRKQYSEDLKARQQGEKNYAEYLKYQTALEEKRSDAFSRNKPLTDVFAKPVEDSFAKLQEKLNSFRDNATKLSADEAKRQLSEIKADMDRLGTLTKDQKAIQYPATAMKNIDTRESVQQYTNSIDEYMNKMRDAGTLTQEFEGRFQDIKSGFQSVGQEDGKALGSWIDQFRTLKTEVQAFQSSTEGQGLKLAKDISDNQMRQIDAAMQGIDKYTEQYGSTAYIDSLRSNLSGIKEEYASIISQLNSGNVTQDQFSNLSQRASELKEQLTQAASASKIFQDGFKNEQALSAFRQSVDDITAKFDEYKTKYQEMLGSGDYKADAGIETRIQSISDALSKGIDPSNIKEASQAVNELGSALDKLKVDAGTQLAKDIGANQLQGLQDMLGNIQNYIDNGGQAGAGIENLKTKITELSEEYQKLQQTLTQKDLTKDQYDEAARSLEKLNDQYKQLNNAAKIYSDGIKNDQALDAFNSKFDTLTQRFENYKKKYEEIINLNPSKASANVETKMQAVQDMLSKGVDPSNIQEYQRAIQSLGTAISGVQTPAQSLGQALQQSFGGVGQYLARFTSSFYIISKGIKLVKDMANEVKAIDTSMMELTKVTNLSGESLNSFVDNAYDVGKTVGRTGKDVIDATTTFSRAGYNLQESMELSKSALVMTNVGVDIPNMESAASDMISILKAYQIEAQDSMSVIDKLYNVANKEPLDFGNITEMLVTAGGTLAQSGTSLEETMGLLTGGFATMRDTSVANG